MFLFSSKDFQVIALLGLKTTQTDDGITIGETFNGEKGSRGCFIEMVDVEG